MKQKVDCYIDTEFNGFGGGLISLAIVTEYGSEFYEVLDCREDIHPWVAEHVMPILEKSPVTFEVFQSRLQSFLWHMPSIRIIADWPDDIKYFCESLIVAPGVAISHPPIEFVLDRTLSSGESKVPHNALHDARAIADQHMSKDYE
jgi:hypothetical protein